MSDLRKLYWQIDCQLIGATRIVNADDSVPAIVLDEETKRAVYKALKSILYKRARASVQASLPLDANGNVELTSDTNPKLGKGKKA